MEKIIFDSFKKEYVALHTLEELKKAKRDYYTVSHKLGIYKSTVKRFIELKECELEKESLNGLIKPFNEVEPLKFNLKGLKEFEHKVNKLGNSKLKYEFEGLFNLLNDSQNLIYNRLYEREKIIKDLNKFKSLKFFKVNYLSKYDLKKKYRFLAYKNGAKKGHSKVFFINHGLYVLKTLNHDDLSLKVFYIGNRYKTLLKSSNDFKMSLKGEKYNLSSTEAYKVLDKEDNMKYYSYCNKIGLDKKNRSLLRSIRRAKKLSSESLIDSLESRKSEIMEDIKDCSSLQVLYYELELEGIEKSLSDLKSHDEDNSLEDKTLLSDYF